MEQSHPVVAATQWGPLLFTLIFAAVMAVVLYVVIRRQAWKNPSGIPAGALSKTAIYFAGLTLTLMFAFYLGVVVLNKIGTPEKGIASIISGITVLEAGLLGALLPYRTLAREGRTQLWVWLATGVAYAFVFYLFAQILR
ncbi:hypothetical protein [Tumebacillus permanentifrigoris]|uniref:Uncharacterized protein n=1 Tax=Tumebacillus permanentifrigoris TaxID=378543 RepID=A0A316D7T9_9BACL|nr:hypothetical protein [Tumebacillus permanentifrigoris]PWK10335.1 hypothetical protein C7459_112157 [Tumebacillus permanentifrigoris]